MRPRADVKQMRLQALQAARGSVEAVAAGTGVSTYELDMLLAKVRSAREGVCRARQGQQA